MRQLTSSLFIFLVPFIISCNKTKEETSLSITGSWELRKSYGGFIAVDTVYYLPGNGNILTFSTTTYQSFSQGRLIETASYKIIKDTTAGQISNRLVLNNRPDFEKIFIEMDSERLKWIDNMPDHGIIEYQRIH